MSVCPSTKIIREYRLAEIGPKGQSEDSDTNYNPKHLYSYNGDSKELFSDSKVLVTQIVQSIRGHPVSGNKFEEGSIR